MNNPFDSLSTLIEAAPDHYLLLLTIIGAVGFTFLTLGFQTCCIKAPSKPEKGVLDPVGGTYVKNVLGLCMAKIAKRREQAHASWTLKELEGFHKPDIHKFWNESYYFNGCDLKTRDRIITRISHRGLNAEKSYVFLLLDLKKYGYFTLEVDDLLWRNQPNSDTGHPSALGLMYKCVDPMQTWKIEFTGKLSNGHVPPWEKDSASSLIKRNIHIDLTYYNESPTFWYMRDDSSNTLAKNLSQEVWGLDFVRYCLARSKNHCHIEAWGSLKGTIAVDNDLPIEYNFGTFRDHSWDIRLWAAIDELFILLLTLEKPLIIHGKEFWYLDLTLVYMPNNSGGVQRYTTGWLGTKDAAGGKATGSLRGNLPITQATSILNIPYKEVEGNNEKGIPPRRFPLPESTIVMDIGSDVGSNEKVAQVVVECTGEIRRLMYWPDHGRFEVFEDSMDFKINGISGYGTRQSGFRLGSYDPSEGGCG